VEKLANVPQFLLHEVVGHIGLHKISRTDKLNGRSATFVICLKSCVPNVL